MPNRRKPRSQKALLGTIQPCRDVPDEAEHPPIVDPPDPPDWLAKVGREAVAEFARAIAILVPGRVLSSGDLGQLAHYAALYGRCVDKWQAGGAPTAAELTQLRLFATEFGLTPASRPRTRRLAAPARNPFADLSAIDAKRRKYFGPKKEGA